MKLTVKRNTGVMGGLARISLYVDEEERVKLRNEEEQMIMIDKEEINIQVKQWFLGSRQVQVTRDEQIAIKINPLCTALYTIAIFILCLAYMSQGGNQQILFTAVGLLKMTIAIFYSMKSFFIFTSSTEQTET